MPDLTRRSFLGAVGATICTGRLAQAQVSKPNVVIIYTDDQGTLDAGCFGSDDIHTPNIDALARRGVRFTQAYAHTVCCPSRSQLLTGRVPQRGGVTNWLSNNPSDENGRNMYTSEVTLAEILRDHGYRTGLSGKWHLGAKPGHQPLDQGFDEAYGHLGGFIDNFEHKFLHSNPRRPPFHDLYRDGKEIDETGRYFPDLVVREATRFIVENKDRPFFLYCAFNVPHYPEQSDPKFDKMYDGMAMPRRSYASMITTTDDRIGQVLDTLEAWGLRDNTLVIFMSDNGHSTEEFHNWGINYGANGGGWQHRGMARGKGQPVRGRHSRAIGDQPARAHPAGGSPGSSHLEHGLSPHNLGTLRYRPTRPRVGRQEPLAGTRVCRCILAARGVSLDVATAVGHPRRGLEADRKRARHHGAPVPPRTAQRDGRTLPR